MMDSFSPTFKWIVPGTSGIHGGRQWSYEIEVSHMGKKPISYRQRWEKICSMKMLLMSADTMFLWKKSEKNPRIITKYSSLTSPLSHYLTSQLILKCHKPILPRIKIKTRGPRATTRSPEWNRHCRYADGMHHFSNTLMTRQWLKQFLKYLAYKVKMLKFSKRYK